MSALHNLRARRASLAMTLELVSRRIEALESAQAGMRDSQRGTAAERIQAFLSSYPELDWSPAELMEATLLAEDSLRGALWRMVADKRIVRERHARYRAVDE